MEIKRFVVMAERSSGNESVGDMWIETATFPPDATLAEIWTWAKIKARASGRIMINRDWNVTDENIESIDTD